MIKPPARLFKYEPILPQSLENLKNQVVFFGNPRNFNDPYDCAIIQKISIPRADELRFWRQRHNNETRVKDASDDVLRGSTIVAAHNVFVKTIAGAENIGITCFSECCDILLLLSHYASKGSGFCLEFKTDADSMFEKAFPVSYVDAFPCISAMATVLKNVDILTALYRTKSKDWEYEKEWRIYSWGSK